ncbi:MAG TPA: hypothetical protein VFR47_21290 [Anaerolineales bacterium]|nr:hypothetical protein [Anaerolineales bacterium]
MKKVSLFISMFIVVALACDLSVTVPPASSVPLPTNTIIPALGTPTPEIFIARTQAVPAQVQLNGITLVVQEARLNECDLPDCPPAPTGTRYLRLSLQALNLPTDQFLDYKNLPEGIAIHDNTGTNTAFDRLAAYSPSAQQLNLYFAVPESAKVFSLQWPAAAEIPLTTTPQTTYEGAKVFFGPISLVIPPGLASGMSTSQFPRADGPDIPEWERTPGHTQLKLEGYLLQGKLQQPQILVYPAMAYVELYSGAFESIHRLDNILGIPGMPIGNEQLPTVPSFNNATQAFGSNIQVISFQNGRGIRFLTEYGQYPVSANNNELFYHFQGLTSDGNYYIIAILPVTAPVLAETSDAGAVLPPGGVPYPYYADPSADMQAYYTAVTDLLNATPSEAFSPTLNQLDLLIQSMKITP